MQKILIGSGNPFKAEKLADLVTPFLQPVLLSQLPDVEEPETGSFLDVARVKAESYSKRFGGYAISSDGGAEFPGLFGWDSLKTRRFVSGNDQERIAKLLDLMAGTNDRTVRWKEAIAVALDGKTVFSAEAYAMDGTLDTLFDPNKYQKGIWLCSVTSFPKFGGRNYFDLTMEERTQTEDSWSALKSMFAEFAATASN